MSIPLEGRHEIVILVRPTDLDSLGHCNNARIVEILETARWEWTGRAAVHGRQKYAPIISKADLHYRGEVFAGEIKVQTWIEPKMVQQILANPRTPRFEVHQQIYSMQDKLLVDATFKIACIDTERRRPVPVQNFTHPFQPKQQTSNLPIS